MKAGFKWDTSFFCSSIFFSSFLSSCLQGHAFFYLAFPSYCDSPSHGGMRWRLGSHELHMPWKNKQEKDSKTSFYKVKRMRNASKSASPPALWQNYAFHSRNSINSPLLFCLSSPPPFSSTLLGTRAPDHPETRERRID